MDPIMDDHPLAGIRESRDAIAHQWFLDLASAGFFQLDRAEAIEKFSHFTDQVIAILLDGETPANTSQAIGEGLADLPCVDPLAMEMTAQLWARQLHVYEFPVAPEVLHPRMIALFGGMVAGFGRRARDIVLEQQEDIRSAMASDLLSTTEELKKYQTHLEAMLAERTRELRESEEQFRVIAETSVDGVFQSIKEDGQLIYVNNSFAKMLGYTKEELLARTTVSLFPKEDLPKLAPIADQMRGNRPVQGEFRLTHKDGRLVNIHFSNVPTLLNGRIVRSGFVQDITERKHVQEALFQSEERYRTLAEASPDMIFIIGQDDRIQYVNDNAAAFLGLPAEDIVGQPRRRFFPSNPQQRKDLQKVLKHGKPTFYEDEIRYNEGVTWLGTWLVPLRDVQGDISAVMGVSRDITKRKQNEIEIMRSRDELEKRVQERTAELSASQTQLRNLADRLVTAQEEERRRISRELHDEAGQALISLKYSLVSLESEIPDNNLYAKSRLVNSIDNIDQITDQIRMLSHSLRPPVLEVIGIDLSLKDCCEEFAKRTGLAIHYQGVEIPGLPDQIGISLYRFAQEALTNIGKHAHATKAQVRLAYAKKWISLTVSDNGRGMEAKEKNDGMGLIGIQERLSLLGGDLQIRSQPGRGVTLIGSVPWPRPDSVNVV